MKATIPTPTRVRTLRCTSRGPTVNATARRSMEKGPTEAATEVVKKSRAALSGKKDFGKPGEEPAQE
jgi:hypothetical protein